ncbi:MAG: nucleotidyltransferase [Bacilli bacterium]|nr:nucleotidyltransferase [Bacilli bacterium]
MKAIGIVAEYNPFHNGHLYQINKIKEKYPDHIIVVVMTGNYTERGEVSILDKFTRSKIALANGVDLVVELPFPFATQSADIFAYGAITILEKLHVEKVIFGSESDNVKDLEEIVDCQLNNNEFDKLVHVYSKFGNNYPTSLSLALKDLTGKVIDTPNDLLGISYIKAIKQNNYKIKYETIKRTNNYHSTEINNEISSATSIRNALKNKEDISALVPNNSLKYYKNLHFIEDYYSYLKYKILTDKDLSIYQTVSEGIENLMKKEIINCNNYYELIEKLQSKRYTTNKIQRMLLHILVNFTKEEAKQMNNITYLRLLGFSNTGRDYLNSIKKELDIPIISKINRNKDKMLEYEIETTKIYALPYNNYLEEINKEYINHLNKGEEND